MVNDPDRKILAAAFMQARLKIDRAKRHLHELDQLISEYSERCIARVVVEFDPKIGAFGIQIRSPEPMPWSVPLAIGDAIHCLRTSLDYLTSGALRAIGKDGKITFPMRRERGALENTLKSSTTGKKATHALIRENFPELADLIVKEIRPYLSDEESGEVGDQALWAVSQFDNIDKHNLIVPSLALTELQNVRVTDRNQNTFILDHIRIEAGGIFRAVATDAVCEIQDHGRPVFEISFPESAKAFAGESVPEAIRSMLRSTTKAVAAVENLFFPPSKEVAGPSGATNSVRMQPTSKEREDISSINPLDHEFHNQRISFSHLASRTPGMIKGKTFIDCELLGPAGLITVATRPEGGSFTGTTFISCNWILVRDDARINNVIVLEDCRIVGGTVHGVSFYLDAAGAKEIGQWPGMEWITYPLAHSQD